MNYKQKLDAILNESGLSRLYSLSRQHDYGIISACRQQHPYKLKRRNTEDLLNKLRSAGYGVTHVNGSYIENYGSPDQVEVKEPSYFVVDLQDRGRLRQDLFRLGEFYDQDSIIFGEAGQQGILIGTSQRENSYPGYKVENPQGGAVFGKSGEFMSRVHGRPFIFA